MPQRAKCLNELREFKMASAYSQEKGRLHYLLSGRANVSGGQMLWNKHNNQKPLKEIVRGILG